MTRTKTLRDDLGLLLKSSYLPQMKAKEKMKDKGYDYDHNLSTMETKVFVKDGKPVIVHRGTKNLRDVGDDILVGLGLESRSHRFRQAKRINDKVEKKYGVGADNIGHSLGGKISEYAGKNSTGNIMTYNKAVGLGDIFQNNDKQRQHDITTKGDLVSGLGYTQTGNREVIENKHPSHIGLIDALNAHKIDNLFK